MPQSVSQTVRRFRVLWGEIDETLGDGERVAIGIFMDQGERIILVEYSPAVVNGQQVKPDDSGWRHVFHDGVLQLVTNIPGGVARAYFESCQRRALMDRYRHHEKDGLVWIINRFLDLNEPLVLAEIELSSPRATITFPRFVHPEAEVTGDAQYDYYQLASVPFGRRR